jgi:hypothetical protein
MAFRPPKPSLSHVELIFALEIPHTLQKKNKHGNNFMFIKRSSAICERPFSSDI